MIDVWGIYIFLPTEWTNYYLPAFGLSGMGGIMRFIDTSMGFENALIQAREYLLSSNI
jgi:hypothetical protein